MSVKTRSSTKCYCTKVLVLLTLLACINVVSVTSMSKGVARSSQTLETLTVGHADMSKRFLRVDTTTTTHDGIDTFQERSLAITIPGLGNVESKVKSGLEKLIQKLQLRWWRLRQKSPNDVFTLLKLDQTGNKLFENKAFSQWAAFVTVRSKDPDMAMFSTFARYYTDDALATMLAAAKDVDSTKAIATRMEGLQITNWVTAGNSADEVFKILQLDRTGDKLFESAVFSNWIAFVAKRNSKDPELFMFSTLATHYTDDALAKMLVAAKEVDSTKAFATKMEGLQITNWVNAEKSAEDVFKILKLDQTGTNLFKSPVLSLWTTFVAKVNRDNPNGVIVAQLKDLFGDAALAKMISAATKVDSTKKLATDLRSVQFKNWLARGITPHHVDIMLNVAANSDDVTKKISRDYVKFYG